MSGGKQTDGWPRLLRESRKLEDRALETLGMTRAEFEQRERALELVQRIDEFTFSGASADVQMDALMEFVTDAGRVVEDEPSAPTGGTDG